MHKYASFDAWSQAVDCCQNVETRSQSIVERHCFDGVTGLLRRLACPGFFGHRWRRHETVAANRTAAAWVVPRPVDSNRADPDERRLDRWSETFNVRIKSHSDDLVRVDSGCNAGGGHHVHALGQHVPRVRQGVDDYSLRALDFLRSVDNDRVTSPRAY